MANSLGVRVPSDEYGLLRLGGIVATIVQKEMYERAWCIYSKALNHER